MSERMRALIAFLLLCGVFLTVFGCGPSKESQTTGNASTYGADAPTTAAEEPSFQEVLDSFASYDYKGEAYTILTWGENIARDDSFGNGNVLSDVLYRRNTAVEQLLSVEIDYALIPDTTDTAELCQYLLSNWNSYGSTCDLVMLPAVTMGVLTVYDGLFADLRTMEQLRLTDAWWSRSAVDELTVHGKTFLTVGAINHDAIYNSEVLLCNEEAFSALYPNRNLERLVNNRQWTRDQLLRFSVALPEHKTMSYGYMGDVESMAEMMLISTEIPVFSSRIPSGYAFDPLTAERLVDSLRTWSITDRANWQLSAERETSLAAFCNEETLFCSVRLRDLMGGALNAVDFSWTVLPFPSFTEGEEYVTAVSGEYSALAIPEGRDSEKACVVLNALNAYDYYAILPTVYNHMLSGKYAADQTEADMLDRILASRSFSFERIYGGDPDLHAGEFFLLLDSLLTGESVSLQMQSRSKQVRDHWICVFRSFGYSLDECEVFPLPDFGGMTSKNMTNSAF